VKKLLVVAMTVFALSLGGHARAQSYNAVNDFSVASNPNGAWSYLYSTPFPSLLPTGRDCIVTGLECWFSGLPEPNSVTIAKNTTASTLSYETIVQSPNVLEMDPESHAVILQFTVPAAGTYSIAGDFTGIDTSENSHPVAILDDGTSIFSGTIANFGGKDPFNLTEMLNVNDRVDFEVMTGTGGSCTYCYLSTGLDATLTVPGIPEPATVVLFSFGLVGLGVIRRRRAA
jgi:hypothetical protein